MKDASKAFVGFLRRWEMFDKANEWRAQLFDRAFNAPKRLAQGKDIVLLVRSGSNERAERS
jgi:hypothetical protein